MSKRNQFFMAAMAALTLGGASCSKDVFNLNDYNKIVKYLSPVDSVDQRHNWSLTEMYTYSYKIAEGADAERIQIFTANPLGNSSARLVTQVYVSDGQSGALTVSVPSTLTSLYAALVKTNGQSLVKEVGLDNQALDFGDQTAAGQTIGSTPVPQAYTFLFEESMPEPGDYDYNDVVMRIGMERAGKRQLRLTVTLAAVGAEGQLGGAVRLVGINRAAIDSVTTADGTTFNDGLPRSSRIFFDESTSLLTEGQRGEAVVELFQDAHWAMGFNIGLDYGYFTRKKYNVSTGTSSEFQLKSSRTKTYNIYFNTEKGLDDFTLDSLDPFIVNTYNGSFWEVHLYAYQNAQVVYNYTLPNVKDLPWALKVPSADFKYPLEGVDIGFRKNGALFGAYMTEGHSFGEWCENYTSNLDWYYYPTDNMVF